MFKTDRNIMPMTDASEVMRR